MSVAIHPLAPLVASEASRSLFLFLVRFKARTLRIASFLNPATR